MEARVGEVAMHFVEHGAGTAAPETLLSADDVLDTLLAFADHVTSGAAYRLVGHPAGGSYAQAMAARRPHRVAGLALICPLLPGLREVPAHQVVVGAGAELGDSAFRAYFGRHTPEMLERYERYVAPAAALVDEAALQRLGEHWELSSDGEGSYPGPTLIAAGRLDATVGYAAAIEAAAGHPTPRSRCWTTPGRPCPTRSSSCCGRCWGTGGHGSSARLRRDAGTWV
ncbi:MAG: alpha/beta hydrolase family protein [Friedmanniella sp.]|nr:alpha/beta hydrolase family protein [Friedmanniella sp.]